MKIRVKEGTHWNELIVASGKRVCIETEDGTFALVEKMDKTGTLRTHLSAEHSELVIRPVDESEVIIKEER